MSRYQPLCLEQLVKSRSNDVDLLWRIDRLTVNCRAEPQRTTLAQSGTAPTGCNSSGDGCRTNALPALKEGQDRKFQRMARHW